MKKLYKGFTLINGTGETPVENAYFIVEDKKITKVGKGEFPTSDMEVVDLSGKTVMPGLINSHVHITMEPVGDPVSIMEKESAAKQH